ncbi:MAG: deoxynucleoside kinase [Nanoarchaeota archaeon]|nr:deoxynucleoside kinase [Nanoarchaeota archaeon]
MGVISISDLVNRPYFVYIVGEMGSGKTTFLDLLDAYQVWLGNLGLEDNIFFTFTEPLPEKKLWDRYKECKNSQIRDPSIYMAQSHFAKQKRTIIDKAAGLEGERKPGFYFVDRSLQEDFYVFAKGLENLFTGKTYARYVEETEPVLNSLPSPDLVVRLRVERPEVSQKRVEGRGWGEKLPLSRYHKMAEDYQRYIDPWIEHIEVPVISIRTDLPQFDFDTAAGQSYFLWTFLAGIRSATDSLGQPFWKLPYTPLPQEKIMVAKQ